MDIQKELSSAQIVLLVIQGAEYNEKIAEVLKRLFGNVCYVTTNKTYDSLKEIFSKNKIKNQSIVFIDTISKTMKKVEEKQENVYFVSSPGALTELSLVIDKFLKHDFDYLIFDSITNLTVYQNQKMCTKFVADLVNKIKKTKTKTIFYGIESKENEAIISKMSTMVDKVVR